MSFIIRYDFCFRMLNPMYLSYMEQKKSRLGLLMGVAFGAMQCSAAFGISTNEINLTNNADFTLKTVYGSYGFGGDALVGTFQTQPAGTGVFDPFLTIQKSGSGGIERGYNTDGVLYMDQQRPSWNTLLKLSSLATINIGGASYYGFELDANEPGNDKSVISIDNIRIYTSSTNTTGLVKNNESYLGNLGVLRWAMNDPLKHGSNYDVDQWIKLDANQNQGNGGSGISDMILYVPTTAFAGAGAKDFVWFYNVNGVHYTADSDMAAQAGYEEWRAVVSTSPPSPQTVPENGCTLGLLGLACVGLASAARFAKGRHQTA